MKVENPPAFPRDERYLGHNGMWLRDWFAGQALGYLGQRKDITVRDADHIAAISYELADAMLAERMRGPDHD